MALFIIKMYIFYTAQFTRHKLRLLSSYRNTNINQSARVFSLSYFKSLYSLAFGCGLWGKAKVGPLKKKKSFMNYFTLLLLFETLNIQGIKRHLTQFVFQTGTFQG